MTDIQIQRTQIPMTNYAMILEAAQQMLASDQTPGDEALAERSANALAALNSSESVELALVALQLLRGKAFSFHTSDNTKLHRLQTLAKTLGASIVDADNFGTGATVHNYKILPPSQAAE
jgi:hypothetical protein